MEFESTRTEYLGLIKFSEMCISPFYLAQTGLMVELQNLDTLLTPWPLPPPVILIKPNRLNQSASALDQS